MEAIDERSELVLVDLRGPGDGWRDAHEGRDGPEDQYTDVWQLDDDHFILQFPSKERS